MASFRIDPLGLEIYKANHLERFMPRPRRLLFLSLFSFLALALGMIALVLYAVGGSAGGGLDQAFAGSLGNMQLVRRMFGLSLMLGSVGWIFMLLEFYLLSIIRPKPFLVVSDESGERVLSLDAACALGLELLGIPGTSQVAVLRLRDIFTESPEAFVILQRLGVSDTSLGEFLARPRPELFMSRDEFLGALGAVALDAKSSVLGMRELLGLLMQIDKDFEQMLFAAQVHKTELYGAASWVRAGYETRDLRLRWWDAAYLAHVPRLGTAIAYGYTYLLDRHARELVSGGIKSAAHMQFEMEVIQSLESALSRSAEANVLFIGEPGSGKHTILEDLARTIMEGTAAPALQYKRVLVLDTSGLTAGAKTKGDFEELVIRVMNEAVRAGNIILVIENFAEFLESAHALGVDAMGILEPYLKSSVIQVVALSDPNKFHNILEPNGVVMQLFSKIDVPVTGAAGTIIVLEDAALEIEARFGVLFTYQALKGAAELADRYIVQGVMPEKAIDLLDRAAASSSGPRPRVITREHIEAAVEASTKIPVAKAREGEAQKLLKIEEILHQRIIGQDEAVRAVSNALRKARSGLHGDKRPIGSFLFLGPTGVGKTETAKALAEVYFGSEEAMSRFDMSEYQSIEGIEKFIGAFATKEQGTLATALRSRPFSLALFDEFEKSSKEVINLFLQILEEGFFTDAFGKRVSARDTIIIATSNAGSNLIWDLVRAGKDPVVLQREVVDAIRQQGVFSPEILNRFDAIVVFHPLDKSNLVAVARLLLEDLRKGLAKQDIDFVITDDLVVKIAEIGYDPVMGARPMRRAISDRVEQVIAQKILEGKLTRGSQLSFTPEEISSL
ncbi:MAG: hypothetical protein A2756_04315 [Candidatus Ryanbacteria bacterium RIFCSPHIGHO2_01_FULL_48_27]|uniref:Clp R domain-containing protein n=1 Tax=Candidatus Ryanbacteria bacterium RIFCSPHIGHO2_01_FULL_48_27 TaxID=1802115 RepID=A0A1G2G396_9BACT|nr:MAG: hypothetical protein A2756_04315 [Candidatus Ryanbacteria bacterium RIFCSPHIGHO2_01_FULL_48_27]